ncbi:MAG: hypothetical protein ACREYF_09945 [Gammaproteobacteria bacterium]
MRSVSVAYVFRIHFGVRLEDAVQCILVVIGATADGKKELLALGDEAHDQGESKPAEIVVIRVTL